MTTLAPATTRGLAGCALLAIATAAHAGATVVETFNGQFQAVITLPLIPDGGDLVAPPGPVIPQGLDFTPGSVSFEGQPVDFDGTEADFLASTYDYNYAIPAVPGPAVVPAIGGFNGGGIVWPALVMGEANVRALELGPAFAPDFLDIVPGQSSEHETVISNWSSPVVPELNGRTVICRATFFVAGVDPVVGLLDLQVNGVFLAVPCPEDLDHDGFVGIADFLQLLGAWGPCGVCPEDLDNDGTVGILDFLQLLAAWGPCP